MLALEPLNELLFELSSVLFVGSKTVLAEGEVEVPGVVTTEPEVVLRATSDEAAGTATTSKG